MKYLMIILVSLNLVACGQKNTQDVPAHVPSLIVFGDSIAYGYNVHIGYSAMLAQKLNLPITQLAIPGSYLQQDVQYKTIMATTITAQDVVIFTPGINDAFTFGHDAAYLAKYRSMLTDILNKLDKSGARVIVGTTLHSRSTQTLDDDAAYYAQVMVDLVAQLPANSKVKLLDERTLFPNVQENFQDGVHPSQLGHEVLLSLFSAALAL